MKAKYALLLCGLINVAVVVSAATTADVLADVDRLVTEKKYLSAFRLLEAQENGDSNPDIALKKAELVLKYFVSSIYHTTFTLADLKEDQEIMDVRGKPGASIIINFDMEKVFTPLINNYPEDQRLYSK
jgi:hypothetical protein